MTEIVINPVSLGHTGQRWEARLGDEVIVKSSRDPEHDAARVLLARGITGRMTTVGADGVPRMSFVIEKTAPFSLREVDRGMSIARWAPYTGNRDES
jgi:hypothetical protein